MAMAVSMSTARRKHAAAGVAAGEWAAVSGAGAWRVEEVGKQQLMRRTGLPPRDLRALDPALSCPSGILGRERAVVVRLEQVRAIVTASEVLVPSPHEPGVEPLVRELRSRLASTHTHTPTASPLPSPAPPQEGEASISITSPPVHGRKEEAAVGSIGKEKDGQALCSDKELPFEFRALEVCLEFACKSLEHETSTLEKEAYPALDELTSKVSTLNLERVRQIKSRLVAISGRVQKIRDELEHLLDDEMDMAAMHLTEKLAYQAVQSSRFDSTEKKLTEFDEESDGEVEEWTGSEGGRSEASSSFVGFRPNIDELEILLEAYFVHIDGTLNKLSTLREYVEDTEDYINIMLDDKQNQLLQMGIMLSTATLVLSAAIAATGVFGINIHVPLYEAPTNVFWQTTYGLVGGSVALYIIALICYKRSGILQ